MENMVQYVVDAVSTATIMSCTFLKIPQIISIRQKKSAEGLYIQAMLLEVLGFSIMTLYNFTNRYSLKTYLEYPIILMQVYVMIYHVLKYDRMLYLPIAPVATLAYFAVMIFFILGILPKEIIGFLVPFCTPLSGFAKVTYMYGIIQYGSAETVSLTTWIISVFTNVSRVFTVYCDSGDIKLLFNFIISTMLSAGVLFTAYVYKCKDKPIGRRSQVRKSHGHTD